MTANVRLLRAKYGSKRKVVDGHSFPSLKEARRYEALKLLQRGGEIECLTLQPRFPMIVEGLKVCTYVADFAYRLKDGTSVTEDCKGFATDVYKIKKKLLKALYGIDVLET